MRGIIRSVLFAALAIAICAGASSDGLAQSAAPAAAPLKISTRVVPPFVFRDETGKLTGFSIELWDAIAKDLGMASDYVVANDVAGLLADVAARKTDLGIAAISITAARENLFDFSQPMFDGGLRIATTKGSAPEIDPLRGFLSFVFSRSFLEVLGAILILMLLPAPFIWLAERNSGEELLEAKTPLGQFGQAIWWSVCALVGQAQDMPSRLIGRLIAIPWIMFAVLFASYFTAAVTTRMTVKQLERGIEGPQDLPGRSVVSVAGSTAAAWLREHNIAAAEFPSIEAALRAMDSGTVQAIVYDEPVLAYYASHTRNGQLRLVGSIFQPEHYGVVFLRGSVQRKAVNQTLLKLKENGEYTRIQQKWFGNE